MRRSRGVRTSGTGIEGASRLGNSGSGVCAGSLSGDGGVEHSGAVSKLPGGKAGPTGVWPEAEILTKISTFCDGPDLLGSVSPREYRRGLLLDHRYFLFFI